MECENVVKFPQYMEDEVDSAGGGISLSHGNGPLQYNREKMRLNFGFRELRLMTFHFVGRYFVNNIFQNISHLNMILFITG